MRRIIILAFLLLLPFQSHALEANSVDSDHDGLSDEQETITYHTDPLNTDTDGDGFSDGQEIANGFSPHLKGAVKLTQSDFDHDGLSDALELQFHTDVGNPDMDGDGYPDGVEVNNGYDPNDTNDATKKLPKSIVIDLKKQRLKKVLGTVTLAEYPISSGKWNTPTPKGTFKVIEKSPRRWSSASKLWMPWWMMFTTKGHGLHELPEWPNGYKEGQNHLGTPVSHGCIRLGVGPAKELYSWAPMGTTVTVQ